MEKILICVFFCHVMGFTLLFFFLLRSDQQEDQPEG